MPASEGRWEGQDLHERRSPGPRDRRRQSLGRVRPIAIYQGGRRGGTTLAPQGLDPQENRNKPPHGGERKGGGGGREPPPPITTRKQKPRGTSHNGICATTAAVCAEMTATTRMGSTPEIRDQAGTSPQADTTTSRPLGRGQNCVNPSKRGDSGGSGVARSYYNGAARWRVYGNWEGGKRETLEALEWPEVIRIQRGAGGCMATGKGAKLCKSL